ncbi:MAG TPA: hypothetical protein VE465_13960 [Streptosporangiaceae bacterium]|nr:hypothetical protein [Streptosporangiaceae bacterium]
MTTKTSRRAIDDAEPKRRSPAGGSFNLRDLVRDVTASSPATDPGSLADEVARRIPAEHRDVALRAMLRGYVREFITQDRMTHTDPPARAPKPTNGGRSWKRDGIRDAWRKRLQDRLHVAADASAWKFLGDCGYDDLTFAALERRTAAERTLSKAEEYEALADLLKEHGVETVRELPAEVLASRLDGGDTE